MTAADEDLVLRIPLSYKIKALNIMIYRSFYPITYHSSTILMSITSAHHVGPLFGIHCRHLESLRVIEGDRRASKEAWYGPTFL